MPRPRAIESIADNQRKTDRLLDSFLDGLIDKDAYQRKARDLGP